MHLLCQAFVLFSEPEEYVSFPSSCCFKSLLEKVNPKNIICELTLVSLICATKSISIMWGPTFTLNEETCRKRLAPTLTIRKNSDNVNNHHFI